jgi:exo-beta-1,3-glucanase (GH17 family)/cellulose synthase/poly-beta-1,6-N-acetylglucosamine synthase-like glycosyltransferase
MRTVVAVVALVAGVQAGLWALTQTNLRAPNVEKPLASVSYAPFASSTNPDEGGRAKAEQIRSDLKLLAPMTRAIRTYSSTAGVELVPGIASEFDLRVTIGAWIDKHKDRNEREIRSVIDLAHRHGNVNGIFVGNETIYRGDETVPDLIKKIQRVKRSTNVPVTTGEIWHVWMQHPELVSAVDYIAAHILPYWEGFSAEQSVDQAILIYDKLRQAYPGKRIVIAEFGWPSAGYNLKNAIPGRIEQAQVLRDFVTRAEAFGIDYNIVEAIDQPWKIFEGGVGPYWGLFDASRHPKFAWSGPITAPDHWRLAGIALLVSILLSIPVLAMRSASVWQAVTLSAAANVVGAWSATVFAYWNGHYFVWGAAFALGLGMVLMVPLIVIALARIEELAEIAFGRKPLRLIAAPPLAPEATAPKVSIHIPAYREPPAMLMQTLDAVARLDYPNFECIVLINNTPDPALWLPIEQHCRALGDRFKFVKADDLAGFKAGALRLGLTHTAPDAEIIGVIDADYVVHPDWLKDLTPLFGDANVGLVQAPQDHRDGERSLMHHAMNGEYAGFFDIGMVQRNEANAIIVHGTMCLIRRSALQTVGGWSSDTICEDTDLGLTLLEAGWRAHYTNKRYGYGLLPDSFDAYKKQRHRWAYGGFQIVKKHWRRFLPGASRLTHEQKREFAMGWLNWLGAESIGVVVAILNIVWVPVVAFLDIAVPDGILTMPIIATFAVSLAHFLTLYRLRVRTSLGQLFGSVFAAMSV